MKVKVKFIRPVIGILLIALSITALVWWETAGRQALTMESVMVASESIQKGQVIGGKSFYKINVDKEAVIQGSVNPESFVGIKGCVTAQYIPKGAQVTKNMFIEKNKLLKNDNSLFSIKPAWIDSRSSSLRKGDRIDIFDDTGELYVGTFEVAYVKDENEQEVVGTEQNISEEMLQRDFSSSVIAHVEIIATMEDYIKIRDLAELQQMKLLLVQK